jgi:hypothetical protein
MLREGRGLQVLPDPVNHFDASSMQENEDEADYFLNMFSF